MTTTYLVTRFQDDPDDGHCMLVDGDQLDGMLAEFRTDPGIPEGAGMLVRKADYMAPVKMISDHINAPGIDKDERRRRKEELFVFNYGNAALRESLFARHTGTVTGRMERPPESQASHLTLVKDGSRAAPAG